MKKASVRSSRVKAKPVSPAKRSSAKKTAAKTEKKPPVKRKQTVIVGGEAALPLPIEAPVIEVAVAPKQKSPVMTNILRALALLVVIGITFYIISIKDQVEAFEAYGYPGIFMVALLANATVLIPAPGVAIIYAMGAVFNPFLVGLAAGTGGAVGELSGYLAGFSGQAVVERTDMYDRFKPWVDKYGGWAIMVLSAIPNPFFDVAGIAAGISKMKMRTFLLSTWAGQLIKMTLFALAGKYSIEWIAKFLG